MFVVIYGFALKHKRLLYSKIKISQLKRQKLHIFKTAFASSLESSVLGISYLLSAISTQRFFFFFRSVQITDFQLSIRWDRILLWRSHSFNFFIYIEIIYIILLNMASSHYIKKTPARVCMYTHIYNIPIHVCRCI